MTELIPSPEIHDDGSTDHRIQAGPSSHVNVVRVDFGGTVYVALIAFAMVIGACGVVMGIDIAERTTLQEDYQREQRALENEQRAVRMAELKYDELNLTLQRAGIVLPGDYRRGVTGNTSAKEHK